MSKCLMYNSANLIEVFSYVGSVKSRDHGRIFSPKSQLSTCVLALSSTMCVCVWFHSHHFLASEKLKKEVGGWLLV